MGNATTVCSDKTGTLTENKMTMVAATIGTDVQFGKTTGPEEEIDNSASIETQSDEKAVQTTTKGIAAVGDFLAKLSTEIKSLLAQSIVINSTAFEGEQDGKQTFIGSKTETALLEFARTYLGTGPLLFFELGVTS
ncbi:hypothetical protein BKA65DRAFT_577561 [Rhexocercosporidium sp. MPI-PUGE-AT-0058]|nr:hypothetical protein BKA65DRAFT_577561 [Rhexocercosporidium sp. MPI-PUGE-AT-0058]